MKDLKDLKKDVALENIIELVDINTFTAMVAEMPLMQLKVDLQKLLVQTYYYEGMSDRANIARKELHTLYGQLFGDRIIERVMEELEILETELKDK